MRSPFIPSTALVLASALVGCEGKAPYAVKAATSEPAQTQIEAHPETPQADPHEAAPAPSPPAEPDDLGLRFRDPPWFRKDLFEHATSTKTARTERDENGLFKSQILFDLPEGTTPESCATLAQEKISTDVSLVREVQPNGRIQLTGSTDRYRVTVVCGEATGVVKAYVGYEWTS